LVKSAASKNLSQQNRKDFKKCHHFNREKGGQLKREVIWNQKENFWEGVSEPKITGHPDAKRQWGSGR